MRTLLQTVEKVLDHDVNLLILGESGSGKDFFAEAIHACGNRRDEPFVHIDCASDSRRAVRVASCSATRRGRSPTRNRASSASSRWRDGGTIYFDDIAALSPTLQAKLLRAIQEKRFTRLGGNQSVASTAASSRRRACPPRSC